MGEMGEMGEMEGTQLAGWAKLGRHVAYMLRGGWSGAARMMTLYVYWVSGGRLAQKPHVQSTSTGTQARTDQARHGHLTNHPKPDVALSPVACRMSSFQACSSTQAPRHPSTPHPAPRSRQAGNAGHQMGASLPAFQPASPPVRAAGRGETR